MAYIVPLRFLFRCFNTFYIAIFLPTIHFTIDFFDSIHKTKFSHFTFKNLGAQQLFGSSQVKVFQRKLKPRNHMDALVILTGLDMDWSCCDVGTIIN